MAGTGRPRAVGLYRFYCWAVLVLLAASVGLSAWYIQRPPAADRLERLLEGMQGAQEETGGHAEMVDRFRLQYQQEARERFAENAVLALLVAAPFVAGLALPRTPGAWIYHLIVIALGIVTCVLIPLCILLLVSWVRPDVQAHFGR